jgi:hypothetical protein
VGVRALLLEVVEADGQIAQGGHDARGAGLGDARAVFAEADIAAMMDAVFDRAPMAAHRVDEGLVAGFPVAEAGDVVADFGFRGFFWWPGACGRELDAFAMDREDLPAAGQSDFLGTDGQALDAAALEPPVPLLPRGVLLRGKKKSGESLHSARSRMPLWLPLSPKR